MKFSREKFEKLTKKRQLKKIADFIKEIYIGWNEKTDNKHALNHLAQLIEWTKEDLPTLQRLITLISGGNNISLKEFDELVIPFLQTQNGNISDDFVIYKNDFTRANTQQFPIFLVLDNLRSVYNVGAIFRSAECFGVSKIYCCGYTPTPQNNSLIKTAMGTEKSVKWEHYHQTIEAIKDLQKKNINIYALELTSKSKNINKFIPEIPMALVLGNEALGVSENILEMASDILYIPMYGNKNSLNVSSSAAVALNVLVNIINKVE